MSIVGSTLLNDPKVETAIQQAVSTTFVNMFSVQTKHAGTTAQKPNKSIEFDLAGTVSMEHASSDGVLTVYCDLKTIGPILERVYGRPLVMVDRDVLDGVGEITNMIYCTFKADLRGMGYQLPMAIPSLNTAVPLGWSPGSKIMQFNTDFGPIFLQMQLEATLIEEKAG